tara:strand:+ start:1495 stop:1638 length:144 start_codon:yes stop_codon:yes gene_type:complete
MGYSLLYLCKGYNDYSSLNNKKSPLKKKKKEKEKEKRLYSNRIYRLN